MIKTRINNEYKDVIKIFGGGILQKEITKVWSREANKYVYESEVEYTGPLSITITADGNALLDYRIYGNTVQTGTPTPENPIMPSGCGVRTENLFDIKKVAGGSLLTVDGTTITKDSTAYNYDIFSGTTGASAPLSTSCMILEAGTYTVSYEIIEADQSALAISTCPYTSETMSPETQYYYVPSGMNFVLYEKSYATIRIRQNTPASIKNLMINLGSTALPYEPYGYKLPILSNSIVTDIYIGDTQLNQGEYVDKETGKIYHIVDGQPTPINPPVPLPEIPTFAGTTVIDYDGAPKPSQMYIKYRR